MGSKAARIRYLEKENAGLKRQIKDLTGALVLGGGVVILALLFIRGWVENSARPLGEMRHEQTEWIDG